MMETKKMTLEQKAPLVAMSVAFFLAIGKFIMGLISGSVALMASAMDSIMDTAVSIFNFFAIRFAEKPADEDHPYGHGKIEGIAATIEGAIIVGSGLFLIWESVKKIISPEKITHFDLSIAIMVVSILATGVLVWFLNYVAKKTGNLVVKGDALHYKMDLITNVAVLITLVIILFYPELAFIDGLVGLLIGLYIIKEAIELITDGVNMLLDKKLEEHEKIIEILEKYKKEGKIQSYHCVRSRASGSKDKLVEFHFVMDPQTTILDAHKLGDEIEAEIKKLDSDANWYVIWHSDPYDDSADNGCK